MSETERLRRALQNINDALHWYFQCGGAVSRDDMVGMIRDAQKEIEAVRSVIWPEVVDDPPPAQSPLSSDF